MKIANEEASRICEGSVTSNSRYSIQSIKVNLNNMPKDKKHKKILELNEEYAGWARTKYACKNKGIFRKICDKQMDRLKKEISELSKQ